MFTGAMNDALTPSCLESTLPVKEASSSTRLRRLLHVLSACMSCTAIVYPLATLHCTLRVGWSVLNRSRLLRADIVVTSRNSELLDPVNARYPRPSRCSFTRCSCYSPTSNVCPCFWSVVATTWMCTISPQRFLWCTGYQGQPCTKRRAGRL